MSNRNTGLIFVVVGMIFFALSKTLTLSTTVWSVFLVLNVLFSVSGAIILVLYIRSERKNHAQ